MRARLTLGARAGATDRTGNLEGLVTLLVGETATVEGVAGV